jgi:hypothetical protein
MRSKTFVLMALIAAIVVFAGPMPVVAQEDTTQEKPEATEEKQESVEEKKKSDNTGTNPINFTYDARFYMETSWFDGGSLIAPTFEFRWPLGRDIANLQNKKQGIFNDLGSKYAMRFKYRPQQNLNLDDPGGDPTAAVNISGMGDLDVRFLAVPHATNKWGVAAGLEAFFPTATNDLLGSGRYVLRPQVFTGFFGLLGKGSIFAPGLLYVFDVGGDSNRDPVEQWQMDIYFVWLLAQQRNWLIINPQPVIDVANDKEFMIVDVEWGYTIPQLRGASIHIRPGVGLGEDKPFDWTFEFGIRFIWR